MKINAVKNRFPIFTTYPDLVYLDSAATAQKPDLVIQSVVDFYTKYNANTHRAIYELGEQATLIYETAREKVAVFINAGESREIVFTKNATEALNLIAKTWGKANLKKGDTVVITLMEHHSNFIPWLMLKEELGINVEVVGLTSEGDVDLDQYKKAMLLAPKLVAFSQMSNVFGNVQPAKQMIALAKAAGAVTVVDACQSVPRFKVDVRELDCDFLVFSAHKMYGPTGVGVLYGKASVLEAMPPFLGGGGMIDEVTTKKATWADIPAKFEAGTPSIEGVAGTGVAIDFLNELGMANIWEHDQALTKYALAKLSELDFVKVLGSSDLSVRGGAISFIVDGLHPHDVAQVANDEFNVCFRAGHHCCQPLMRDLKVPATTRMSFGVYNSEADVDMAIEAIKKAYLIFGL